MKEKQVGGERQGQGAQGLRREQSVSNRQLCSVSFAA